MAKGTQPSEAKELVVGADMQVRSRFVMVQKWKNETRAITNIRCGESWLRAGGRKLNQG